MKVKMRMGSRNEVTSASGADESFAAPHPRLSAIGVTADNYERRPLPGRSLLTQSGH
jgi:hypothetical protein